MTTYSITIPDTMRLGAIHRFTSPDRWSVSVSPSEGEYGNYFVTGFGIDPNLTAAAAKAVADLEASLENLRKVYTPAPKLEINLDLDL